MKLKYIQSLILLVQTANVVWYGSLCYSQEAPLRGFQWFVLIFGWVAWVYIAYMAGRAWKRDV